MDSHAPHGNASDDAFILNQGSHAGVLAATESHTQDFIVTGAYKFAFNSGSLQEIGNVVVGLGTLGARINHADVWQTYKVIIVSFSWYYAGTDPGFPQGGNTGVEQIGDFALSIVPYSQNSWKSSTTLQVFNIWSVPGCHVKYFAGRLYYPQLFYEGSTPSTLGIQAAASYWQTQPQMLKVTNECPMYQVQSVGVSNTQTGQVYSNDPLGLLTFHGRDTNLWHCFLTQVNTFDAVPHTAIVRGNFIM